MAKYLASIILQRFVLPLIITACFVCRPVGISLPYLLLLFVLPFVPVATGKSINGSTGVYMKTSILVTVLVILAQITFQIVLAAVDPEIIEQCGLLEKILRHIGLVRFDKLGVFYIILWIMPEILMLLTTVIMLTTLKKLTFCYETDASDQMEAARQQAPVRCLKEEPILTDQKLLLYKKLAKFFIFASLLVAAAIRPSIPGLFYYSFLLATGTWWACFKEIQRMFAIMCRLLMFVIGVHIVALLAYQNPWPQEFFPPEENISRYLGFAALLQSSCENGTDIREINLNMEASVDMYLNPIALIVCYYICGLGSSVLLIDQGVPVDKRGGRAIGKVENGSGLPQRQVSVKLPPKQIQAKWKTFSAKVNESQKRGRLIDSEVNERTPLMRRSTRRIKFLKQLSTTQTSDNDNIQMDQLVTGNDLSDDPERPTLFEQVWAGIEYSIGFIHTNSYIIMNIIMMTWSIMYHAWLTFVFLIWANILWIIPNQKKSMLRSSPFIVLYAELLLVAQYLYGMDLTEDELPTKTNIAALNLSQIGLIKYTHYPCLHIIIKTLFTIVFWLTLRQMFQENHLKKQKTISTDSVAPSQVTMNAATAVGEGNPNGKALHSPLMAKLGVILTEILVKFWIWIVLLTIYFSGIIGHKMTGFRVVYMCFFLVFLLTFQLSWTAWKKIMCGFWLTVIIYAMVLLTLVYTYQFDGFPSILEEYLNIPESIQRDIGLERYKTKDLLIRLINPTLVVIMTAIQLHYFNSKFLKLIEMPETQAGLKRSNSDSSTDFGQIESPDASATPAVGCANNIDGDGDDDDTLGHENSEIIEKVANLRRLSGKEMRSVYQLVKVEFFKCLDFVYLFLEIHMIKVILILSFVICVEEVSVLHIVLAALSVIAAMSKSKSQYTLCSVMMIIVSILFIAKMLYQVDYIKQTDYDVTCSNTTNPYNLSNSDWFGLKKIDDTHSLAQLVKGYILYLIFITLYGIVIYRQTWQRYIFRKPYKPARLLFPGITRNHADINLSYMIRYLMNHAFYKFGLEICLIAIVFLIGIRMDIIACFYALWLCTFVLMDRPTVSRGWFALQCFIAISILVQYVAMVGIPPGLCFDYPFTGKIFDGLKEWALLPSVALRKGYRKLIIEFILLLFVSRQRLVFKIEERYDPLIISFPGGTNKSVINDIDTLGTVPFDNPTPDFTCVLKNWLDVFKRGILMSSFWITLAIVFLTGTNRVNFFSVGYLIGSFTFLWQGSDFYLRPIRIILKWWRMLLYYNVLIIAMKTFFQIPGCILLKDIESEWCWLVQLLGVICFQDVKLTDTAPCNMPVNASGMAWDTICFGFLIMQLRIFQSHYFCHIINDTKATAILASRGAELIEELRLKQMNQQHEKEVEILDKIKSKMDRIKETQKKEVIFKEPTSHAKDSEAPLARGHSFSSYTGYHTPIEDEVAPSAMNFGENQDLQPDASSLGPFSQRGSSIAQQQAPSPSSAVLTVSLDAYLEPQRLSFSSPPESEFLARIPSSDESFPVFSPPPYDVIPADPVDENVVLQTQLRQPPSIVTNPQTRSHRRQSSLNTVSWPDQPEFMATRNRILSGMHKQSESADRPLSPRIRLSHRRQSSMGTSWGHDDTLNQSQMRNESFMSFNNDDDLSIVLPPSSSGVHRQMSWGPIGEMYHRQSIISTSSRSPLSHHESIRSGDYYMFAEMDDKFQLDIIETKNMAVVEEEAISRKRKTTLTLGSVILTQMKQRSSSHQSSSDSEPDISRRRSSLPYPSENTDNASARAVLSEPITTSVSKQDQAQTSQISEKSQEDEYIQSDGQRPGTSRHDSHQEDDDTDGRDESERSAAVDDVEIEPPPKPKRRVDPLGGLRLLLAFVNGFFGSLTVRLNRFSRNYRYVMKRLGKEKNMLKTVKEQHNRSSQPNLLQKASSLSHGTTHSPASGSDCVPSLTQDDDDNADNTSKTHDIDSIVVDHEKGLMLNEIQLRQILTKYEREREAAEKERRSSVVPEIRILAPSLERGLDETSSPFKKVISIEQLDSEDDEEDFTTQSHSPFVELLISLWFAILSHTDFVCFMIVFLNQIQNASILSLPLPIMVFLWGTLTVPRPSKTFWVTLIAYTQTVVLLKCISQLELLWWNQSETASNLPLAPARIIGIEKKKDYATFDLILLLVLFFHRYMLKSFGLWTTEFSEESLQEGTYEIVDHKDNAEEDYGENNVSAIIVTQNDVTMKLKKVDSEVLIQDNGDKKHAYVSKVLEDPSNYFPDISKMAAGKYVSGFRMFFNQLVARTSRISVDVYAYMFLCDFVNFLVLCFGFTSFGSQQGDGGFAGYLEENKVPITFLIMLILQFVLIIIDRALYLRKNIVGKIMFQFFLVFGIHIWMFFLLPAVTERSFNETIPPTMWYVIKCFYLLFSAYQIRCGYPTRIIGNFLTKGFTLVNLVAFKVFMNIPFLFELRTMMDWVWTDSSMTLFDWLKMEDIFADIYSIKCMRQMEEDFPTPRGQKKTHFSKYIMGGIGLMILITLIWFPLALFALGNTVGEPNPPYDVSVQLRIGPYEPVYTMTAQENNIFSFNESYFNVLTRQYSRDKTALTFLSGYEPADVAAVVLSPSSASVWSISPPDRQRLLKDLEMGQTIKVKFTCTMTRISQNSDGPGFVSTETFYDMDGNNEDRSSLISMLQNQKDTPTPITFDFLFPKFLKVKNSGSLQPAPQLIPNQYDPKSNYRNVSLSLFTSKEGEEKSWWEAKENCSDDFFKKILSALPLTNCSSNLVMYTFSDRLFPSKLRWLTGGGIIGLYTTFVLVVSRAIRGLFSGTRSKIMFEDLPYVDRLLQLCLDIYLVRESLEFALEEDLFAKLIFLYRSPETLIKWTRPKPDSGEDTSEAHSTSKSGTDLSRQTTLSKKHQ